MMEIFSADGWLNTTIVSFNDFFWSYILVAGLIACALWFTWKTHFVQFRMVGEMIRLLSESTNKHDGKKHVSSFQAFAVSIASRVGTGNLAGVASAIAIGGPGAVFWMWVIALLALLQPLSSLLWHNFISVNTMVHSLGGQLITSFMECITNGCRSFLPY